MPASQPRHEPHPISTLLDSVFGFFIWASHLLIVYISTAVACAGGLEWAEARSHKIFLGVLGLATASALLIVALHATRRLRQWRADGNLQFRLAVTVGGDCLAAVAIAWQILALTLVPLCK